MQTSNCRFQLTKDLLQVVRFGLPFDFPIMAVGGGMGSWQFTLGALRSLVAKPTTQVTFAEKIGSSVKLHWHLIITLVGYGNQDSNRPLKTTIFVHNASICKCGTDLLSHLHS